MEEKLWQVGPDGFARPADGRPGPFYREHRCPGPAVYELVKVSSEGLSMKSVDIGSARSYETEKETINALLRGARVLVTDTAYVVVSTNTRERLAG
jgi:hypothetical protein